MADIDLEIAPIRSLDDFLLNSARFQVPNVKDLDKWSNRVFQNLLYYQTNYFISSLVIILLVAVLHPQKFLLGLLSMAAGFSLFLYLANKKLLAEQFKKEHPYLYGAITLAGVYMVLYCFGNMMVVLFGVCLPVVVTFAHASMRLRNMKNKITNKMESLGIKRTPIGLFLIELGVETDRYLF